MKTINLSLVLCLSMPALALAENEATTAYPEMYEASAPAAPATLTAKYEATGKATEKLLSARINEKFIPGGDPVPLSNYINEGHYGQ